MSDWTPDTLKEFVAEQVRRIDQAIKEIHEEINRRLQTSDTARESGRHELERFEADMERQLSKMNEIRGALEDLGKGMATRHELETAVGAIRQERESLVQANDGRLEELRRQMAELRSRLDVGPAELRRLQARSEQHIGAEGANKEIVAYVFAAVTVAVSLAAVLVTLFTH